jgi:hypothetical protein
VLQWISFIVSLVSAGVFLYFVLRYLLLAALLGIVSRETLSKLVSYYDGGQFQQAIHLGSSDLEQWASNRAIEKLSQRLPLLWNQWLQKLNWNTALYLLGVSLLIFIPTAVSPVVSTVDEIITGDLRHSITLPNIPDTLYYNYNEVWEKPNNIQASINSELIDQLIIQSDYSVDISYRGRFYKTLFIDCDSVPQLLNWSAQVFPPGYTQLHPYTSSDTILAYPGSSIQLNVQGLLVHLFQLHVSRETLNNNQRFNWDNDTVKLVFRDQVHLIPVKQLVDQKPFIEVLHNTRDSIRIKIKDDFDLKHASIDGQPLLITKQSALEMIVDIVWHTDKIKIEVSDINGRVVRELTRPRLQFSEISSEASSVSLKKMAINEDLKRRLEDRQTRLKKTEEHQLTIPEKDQNKKENKEQQFIKEQPKPEKETLEKLLERLDQQWKMEQMLELLDKVEEEKNDALDSAVSKLNKELSEGADEQLKEVQKQIDEIPESGEDRKDKAKDAAEALSELLNQEQAAIEEDNVERIKRLLKQSWSISMRQEDLKRIERDIAIVRDQRSISRLEAEIQDSLDVLIVSDAKLAQALSAVRAELKLNIDAMNTQIDQGKSFESALGYSLKSLNELDKTLYFILENAKENLLQSKAKCNNGAPNKKGPPKQGKGTKPGNGEPNTGKKPGGRKQGESGESREGKGEGQKPGSSGKSKGDLLREIEEAQQKLSGSGKSKEREELEKMKEQLLFKNNLSDQELLDIEDKLWEAKKSQFDKEQQGEERVREEAVDQKAIMGTELKIKVIESQQTDLPLPVLKKK